MNLQIHSTCTDLKENLKKNIHMVILPNLIKNKKDEIELKN